MILIDNSAILGVKNTKATDDLRSKKKTIPLQKEEKFGNLQFIKTINLFKEKLLISNIIVNNKIKLLIFSVKNFLHNF